MCVVSIDKNEKDGFRFLNIANVLRDPWSGFHGNQRGCLRNTWQNIGEKGTDGHIKNLFINYIFYFGICVRTSSLKE